jgi:crotonobetaine/carnitine-CoA ligase
MSTTPVLERTIAAVLDKQVAARPDKTALLEAASGEAVTYRQLQERAFRLSAGLAGMGVTRQEPVLVMLDNHIDMVVTWAGIGVGAMIEVPINTAYKGEMLRYIMDHSGATIAVVEAAYVERISEILDGVPELRTIVVRGDGGELPQRIVRRDFAELAGTDDGPEAPRPDPPHVSDISTIIYTSGTEGRSKGVLCPHGHAFQTSASYTFETTPDDVVLVMLPLFHAGGLFAGVYNSLRGGATAVIQPAFTASKFWDEVREFGCTQALLMGAMIDFLWRRPPEPDDRDNPLRNVTVVPAMPYINEFAQRFDMNVTSSYGQSETGTITLTDPGEARPFLCGRPRSFIEMKIVDENDMEVPRGVVGEFAVRSAEPWSMFRGYHRNPEATVHAWRNNWMHTGDAGYQEENGRFVFVDRKRDALRRRGENVSSMEVEKYLLARDDIAAAAINAVPSEHLEDDIKAVLILAEGAEFEPEDILRDMVEKLPYFMVPRYYEAVTSFPMTQTHKVQKSELRKVGITESTWDCEANGLIVTRSGLREKAQREKAMETTT